MENSQLLISSLLAISNLVLIIINFVFNRKNSNTNYYSKILNTKLELVICPIYYMLKINDNICLSKNKDFTEIINSYSYLLDDHLLKLIFEIIDVEKSMESHKSQKDALSQFVNRHNILINRFKESIEKVFKENKSIHQNTYKQYEKELSLSVAGRFITNIINFLCYFFIFSLFVIVIFLFVYNDTDPKYLNSPPYIIMMCLAFIFLIGFVATYLKLIYKYSSKADIINYKIFKSYNVDSVVPEDGHYICQACKTKHFFYANTTFPRCAENKSIIKSCNFKKIE